MEVKAATSFDQRLDPQNVLSQYLISIIGHRDPKSFWMTTGLYPHEILVDLGGARPVQEVKFMSTNSMNSFFIDAIAIVKKVVIEGCKTSNASEFKKVGETKGKGAASYS